MKSVLPCLVLVWFCAANASIAGTYRNELGSVMSVVPLNGSISGWYETPVGQASGRYSLRGSYKSESGPTTITFSVVWNNTVHGDSHSATSWSGYILASQPNTIHTTWILVSEPSSEKEGWSAFRVGQDRFDKIASI